MNEDQKEILRQLEDLDNMDIPFALKRIIKGWFIEYKRGVKLDPLVLIHDMCNQAMLGYQELQQAEKRGAKEAFSIDGWNLCVNRVDGYVLRLFILFDEYYITLWENHKIRYALRLSNLHLQMKN